MNRWLLLTVELAALWPLAGWYARRLYWTSSVLELIPAGVGLVALIVGARSGLTRKGLALPGLFLALYALSAVFLPTAGTAPFAVLVIASTACARFVGAHAFTALVGLGLLTLPALPLLRFELSYPLRVLVAELTAPLLRASGVAVTRSGACLEWAGGLLWVDAPCSGIRFLWTGYVLLFTLALMHRLGNRRTMQAAALTLLVVIAANVLRTASLFYLESGLLSAPAWAHVATGLVIYTMAAMALATLVHRLSPGAARREEPCVVS